MDTIQSPPLSLADLQPAPLPTIEMATKCKIIRQQLALLLHVDICLRQGERASLGAPVRKCDVPRCDAFKSILKHMRICHAGKHCTLQNCIASRQVFCHWHYCYHIDCPVCLPIKQGLVSAYKDPGETPGIDINHILDVLSHEDLDLGSTDSAAQQSVTGAQQLVADLLTAIPIEDIMEWHKYIESEKRNDMVRTIAKGIFPLADTEAVLDQRFQGLVDYAHQLEFNAYTEVHSPMEYFACIAQKVYKAQQILEEKRQKLKEQAEAQQETK